MLQKKPFPSIDNNKKYLLSTIFSILISMEFFDAEDWNDVENSALHHRNKKKLF